MMGSRSISSLLVAASLFFLISCEKSDDPARPEILNFELGMEKSKTAVAGDELHMDAEVEAEGTIDRIEVEIHPEGEHDHMKGITSTEDEGEWEFDTVYTEFSGLKSTEFHEHIEVPADAEAGMYHFHFSVTDMEGYQATYEDEFEVLAPQK